jgi:hypothetical protein
MGQLYIPFDDFVIVKDGDLLASEIANRHYSRIWRGNITQPRFMPPGKRLILMEPMGKWLFAWSFQLYRKDEQTGAQCTIFRNESNILSSKIILKSEEIWESKYGKTRKFTYVHPEKIKSVNPGYCFQCAGWKKAEVKSNRGLVLLVKD